MSTIRKAWRYTALGCLIAACQGGQGPSPAALSARDDQIVAKDSATLAASGSARVTQDEGQQPALAQEPAAERMQAADEPRRAPPETTDAEASNGPPPRPPTDLEVAPIAIDFHAGDLVWAAYPLDKRARAFGFGRVRFLEARRELVLVEDGPQTWTYGAFVSRAPTVATLEPGTPVLAQIGRFAVPARVLGHSAAGVEVVHFREGSATRVEVAREDVLPLPVKAIARGWYATFVANEQIELGRVLGVVGDRVYVMSRRPIVLSQNAVTPVDGTKVYEPGAHVLALYEGAFSRKVLSAVVTHAFDGVGYTVKTAEGTPFSVSFAELVPEASGRKENKQ